MTERGLFDEPAEVEVASDNDICDVCGIATDVLGLAPYRCPACKLQLCPSCEKRHKIKYPEHGGKA